MKEHYSQGFTHHWFPPLRATNNDVFCHIFRLRAFSICKKFGNFLLGISVWEKRVPFVSSPILRKPGRLRVLERHGTGDKTGNLLMSVPQRNERKRGLAGMQRDKAPVEWPRSEGGGTRLTDRCLDDCYGNRRQTDELKDRKAPSSARGRGPGA